MSGRLGKQGRGELGWEGRERGEGRGEGSWAGKAGERGLGREGRGEGGSPPDYPELARLQPSAWTFGFLPPGSQGREKGQGGLLS